VGLQQGEAEEVADDSGDVPLEGIPRDGPGVGRQRRQRVRGSGVETMSVWPSTLRNACVSQERSTPIVPAMPLAYQTPHPAIASWHKP